METILWFFFGGLFLTALVCGIILICYKTAKLVIEIKQDIQDMKTRRK